MSVNAAICNKCNLLRRDYSLEEQSKPFPVCLACMTGSDKHSRRASSAKHRPIEKHTATSRRNRSTSTSTKSSTPSSMTTTTTTSKSTTSASRRASRHDTKLTCTHCGVIQHAHAHFTEAERLHMSPCCRSCQRKKEGHNDTGQQQTSRRLKKTLPTKTASTNPFDDLEEEIIAKRGGSSKPALTQPKPATTTNPFDDDEPPAQLKPKSTARSSHNPFDCHEDDTNNNNTREEKKVDDDSHKIAPPKPKPRDPVELLYRQLVQTLLLPERIWGVPDEWRDPPVLYRQLRRILDVHNEKIEWLVQPLIQGLLSSDNNNTNSSSSKINLRICYGKQNPVLYSLLAWTCHFRYLARTCGWLGQDDIVRLVLATPGVHVNDVFFNKTHAGFFAVVYASPDTLDWLIQSGLQVREQRDLHNRSMLYHALEYPQPAMLRKVLNHVEIATDEDGRSAAAHLFRIGALVVSQQAEQEGSSSSSTAATLMASTPACWRMLGGPPSMVDVSESLIVVRQRGAPLISGENQADAIATALKSLSRHLDKEFVKSLTGQWLPGAIRQRVQIRDQDAQNAQDTNKEVVELCTIHALDTNQSTTALHCGHLFCRECVVGYNDKNQGRPLCPVCSRRMGLDVLSAFARSSSSVLLGAGTGQLQQDLEHEQLKTLSILSDAQVVQEAKCQGLYSVSNYLLGLWSLREKLMAKVLEGHLQPPMETAGGMPTVLDLVATHPHIVTGSPAVTTAPLDGPVCVEIWIKGVPVLAHVSNQSRWTLVSSAVVKNFGLIRQRELACRARGGLKVACLQEFPFAMGDPEHVQVTLHNAIEVPSRLMCGMGIQLGLDFFLSATYCVVDVPVQIDGSAIGGRGGSPPTLMRCDGLFSWAAPVTKTPEKSLRYYARTGTCARLPLLHFNTRRHDEIQQLTLFTLQNTTSGDECHWCCRTCPKGSGMMSCPKCASQGIFVSYCNEHCRRAAYTIHQVNCGLTSSIS